MSTEIHGQQSWGRYPAGRCSTSRRPIWDDQVSAEISGSSDGYLLARGQGRSYGDCCLNNDNKLLFTDRLDRFISFDDQILKVVVPRGWFLPVTPGTKFVSLGGAIANDVHGKNHHHAGTFGRHVREIRLMRSDGTAHLVSPSQNTPLFNATIAGLGLTGFIVSATIQLKPIQSALIAEETLKFRSLDEFFDISAASDQDYEYTVSWIDCLVQGEQLGRGLFMRGNFSSAGELRAHRDPLLFVPIDFPEWTLTTQTMKLFNALYYGRQRSRVVTRNVHYDPFFYPLDVVKDWNRLYGRRGFLQFQCVVPKAAGRDGFRGLFEEIVKSGNGSFLAVIKEFGELESPGMLSFPRAGVTLCLDFAYRGAATLELFARLEQRVAGLGGAMYPAKDACMSSANFRRYFPRWKEFSAQIDPRFSSSFWRRVMNESE